MVSLDARTPAAAELRGACGCAVDPSAALVVGDAVVGRAEGPAARSVWGLLARCTRALQHAQELHGAGDASDGGSESSADTTGPLATPSSAENGRVGSPGGGAAAGPGTDGADGAESAAATAASAAPASDSSAGSVFDPPDPKLAKPGYTKRLPNGETVHYFPKMPCLK